MLPRSCRKYAPLAIAGVLYVLGIGVCLIFSSNWNARQTWAVILTGAVIIWYTWETMRLRQATVAQREIQIRPFVVVQREGKQFTLRNLGPGTALNIRVRTVTINEAEGIRVTFPDQITTLTAGEARVISAESFHRNVSQGDFFIAHLDPEYANRELEITVDFENVDMKPMFVAQKVAPGKFQIIRASSDAAP